jgi:hypothetical protein
MSAGKFSSFHKPADQNPSITPDLVLGNGRMSTFSLWMSFHVDHRGQSVYPHRDIPSSFNSSIFVLVASFQDCQKPRGDDDYTFISNIFSIFIFRQTVGNFVIIAFLRNEYMRGNIRVRWSLKGAHANSSPIMFGPVQWVKKK